MLRKSWTRGWAVIVLESYEHFFSSLLSGYFVDAVAEVQCIGTAEG